jgi:hypothetical protein
VIIRRSIPLLVVLGLLSCHEEEQQPPVAHLATAAGAVTVRPGGREATEPGAAGAGLYIEDIVSTGPDGAAAVEFDGGNKIDLGANTSLVIRRQGGAQAAVGAVLLAGTARAASSGKGLRLTIGTPFGLAEIGGTKVSVLNVSIENGLRVEVGQVEVVSQKDGVNGAAQTLDAGMGLSIDGVVLRAGSATIDGLTVGVGGEKAGEIVLKPLSVTLLANPKQAMVMVAGDKTWKQAKKRALLNAGDRVHIKKGGTGRVQIGEEAALTLKSDSIMDYLGSGGADDRAEASYAIRQGGAQISLLKRGQKAVEHKIQVGSSTLSVRPTVREADVDVSTTKNGGAQVTVRFGQVEIDGQTIEAGQTFDLSKEGKVVGTPRALATTKIDVHPRTSTIVYYDKRVPAINFDWTGEGASKNAVVEIASDKDFKQITAAEQMSKTSLILDGLQPGKFYWRVGGEAGKRGLVQIMEEASNDCANCKRTNTIEDTGEKTVVYYQQALPAIILRWKETPGTAQYNLKVFADGEFDTPLVDEKLTETKRAFDAGRFAEGKYYWLVTSLDKAAKELATGRMNSLQITYDNAITALVIRAPKQGAKVSGGSFTTQGEAELGAKVYLNGKRIEVDENGRFTEAVTLKPGLNQLVYRVVAADGVERYYLREVQRR